MGVIMRTNVDKPANDLAKSPTFSQSGKFQIFLSIMGVIMRTNFDKPAKDLAKSPIFSQSGKSRIFC